MQGLSGLAFTPLLPVALLAALTALSVAVVAYGAWARARGMAWRAVVLAAGARGVRMISDWRAGFSSVAHVRGTDHPPVGRLFRFLLSHRLQCPHGPL